MASQGQDANASVTVSNAGNTTRTFRGMVESRADNSGNWRSSHPITARIPPGKSVQRNITVNSTSNGSVSYRLAPFKTTKTIEYVPPTFAFGKSYKTTQNVEVTVSNLQSAQSVRLSAGMETTQRTPPSGNRFVLVQVESAVVGDSEGTPRSSEFALTTGSQTFTTADGMTQPLVAPVEGTPYGGEYNPAEGDTYSWYVVWTVPQQVPLSELTVEWTSSEGSTGAEGETARWTQGGLTTSN